MKFMADVMLGRLAKQLRLLGVDVLYDPTISDNDLIRLALEQDRIILTRDAALAARPLARHHILIDSDNVDEQVRQVVDRYSFSTEQSLTRCSVCNCPLEQLPREAAQDIVPDQVFRSREVFYHCGECGRTYWQGSHVRNMAQRRTKKAGIGNAGRSIRKRIKEAR